MSAADVATSATALAIVKRRLFPVRCRIVSSVETNLSSGLIPDLPLFTRLDVAKYDNGRDERNHGSDPQTGDLDALADRCVRLCRRDPRDSADAEQALLDFLSKYAPKGTVPMCGNTIGQDRRFMARYMPKLEDWFHYRNLDVSTLKELARRWKPDLLAGFKKAQAHTALVILQVWQR